MSAGEVRKLSNEDIQLVKNRIEQCLQHYMNKKEVISALIIQGNIEPCITELVWQRLEQENHAFFKVYYLKLLVKEQIMEFNRLLSEQVDLMHRTGLSGVTSFPPANGSHVSPAQQISTCPVQNARPAKADNMQQANMFDNCGSAIQSCLQGTIDGCVHSRRIDVSPNLLLSQNSGMGLSQMMNGKSVITEAGYAGSSHFAFSPPSNYLESRPLMGDASVSSFSSVDSNAQHLNDTLLDGDTSSFGFLAQMSQAFPELAADFTTSADLLESYCRPPFLTSDANNFVNPDGDVENLDPEPEKLRFHCFGGD